VIQFGRRDLQGKLQSLKWFVGGKSDKQFKRRFGRTYHKMPKSRPTIHTGYKLRRQEVFRLRKTQRCLVKTSETCQRSLFAVPVKLSCSLNYESYTYFFSTNHFPQCAVFLLQDSSRRGERSNVHKDAVQSDGLLPPKVYPVKL
jgi:hypothetical protein